MTLDGLPPPLPTVLLTGDLNFPLIDWQSESVCGGSADMRLSAAALLSLAGSFCLHQLIDTPTRNSNILDLFFTNDDDIIHGHVIKPTNLSDHNIIEITTNINWNPDIPRVDSTKYRSSSSSFIELNFLGDSVKWTAIANHLAGIPWYRLLSNADHPTTQYNAILGECLRASLLFVSVRKRRS